MRRNLILGLGAALVAASVAAWLFLGPALAAAPALAGTWKVTFFPPTGQEMSLWLLQVEAKKGELTAKVIAAPADELKQAKVVKVDADDKTLRLNLQVGASDATMTIPITMYFPDKETNPKVLRGVMQLRGQQLFTQLERTEAKELDPDSAQDEGASALMAKALRSRNAKDHETLFKDVIASSADQ